MPCKNATLLYKRYPSVYNQELADSQATMAFHIPEVHVNVEEANSETSHLQVDSQTSPSTKTYSFLCYQKQ